MVKYAQNQTRLVEALHATVVAALLASLLATLLATLLIA